MYFPDLIEEYKQSLKDLRAAGGCSSMERDLQEAIKWMETGYDPAECRAASRTDAYAMDHHLMQDLIVYVDSTNDVPALITDEIDLWIDEAVALKEIERLYNFKKVVNNTMVGLTENERTAFIMIRAEHMSFGKTAKLLGVTKSTIQSYITRAEMKIANNISNKIA
ncbi:sigma factor-like helix-turn-helix DNA-binding protein [Lysinibacillus sp. NPDC047702]|uniref:sigma factor-like helix-turn-helix DNA-binding protein n=1 Tax=unclassified Lysinibacillus TaxID=2636778 RepID=UPI003CFEFB34